ncbi:Olfactory receptor 7G2 [Sciurus carolinensis]|uniref:Olfactory receptor 7G2 n=1 Tax=Sciurus carolinensis TaxID=30640 RepID=A0AA41N062_SCICA|nr:Olfactory receptor 7G2 [Sciurus carolinensis]
MKYRNQTTISEFLLLGLTDDPALQPLIFSLFLSMYLVTILGNLLIILDIYSTPKSTPPWMVFDRYVAICHHEVHTAIMNPCLYVSLLQSSLLIRTMDAFLHNLLVLRLSFCTDLEIPHFFCELAEVIELACSDTFINNILVFVAACVFAGFPLSGIIFSYIHIVSSVLRMPSSEGKHKAFSTCGSHLSVVFLFYGTGFVVYISSAVTDSPRKTAVASVMYSVVTQMLNPFIYSLRNKDMKETLRKLIGRIAFHP